MDDADLKDSVRALVGLLNTLAAYMDEFVCIERDSTSDPNTTLKLTLLHENIDRVMSDVSKLAGALVRDDPSSGGKGNGRGH